MAEAKLAAYSKLQAKIQGIIHPWCRCAEKPPFSVERLVLMADGLIAGELSALNVFTWINNNFRYYGNLATIALGARLISRLQSYEGDSRKTKHLLEDIQSVLNCNEVPFTAH